MSLDTFKPQPGEGGQYKKNKPTTLFYNKFDKKKYKGNLLKIKKTEDKQKEREGESIALELEETFKEDMVKNFRKVTKILESAPSSIKTKVGGETFSLRIATLLKEKKAENPATLLNDVENKKTKLENIEAVFNLEWRSGLDDPLFLKYTTPVTEILKGGGNIEENLKKLITEEFAGVDHYKKMLTTQQKLPHKTKENQNTEKEKEKIRTSLKKDGAIISELSDNNSGLYSVIANFPAEEKQIYISTTDSITTYIAVNRKRRKKEAAAKPPLF